MISLIIPNIKGKTKTFWAKITIGTSTETIYYPFLKEFGKFSIGNDNAENEMILYPGQFDISVILNSASEYHGVINLFRTEGTASIEIRADDASGQIRGQGETDYLADNCDPYKFIIALSFYDEFSKLNDSFDFSIFDPPPGNLVWIDDRIEEIMAEMGLSFGVSAVDYLRYKYYDNILATDGEGTIGEAAFTASNFKDNFAYDASAPQDLFAYSYNQPGQMMTSILNQFAAIGVIEGGILNMYPRYNHDDQYIVIARANCLINSIKMGVAKKFKGLRIFVKQAATHLDGRDETFKRYTLGEVKVKPNSELDLEFEDDVESIYLPAGIYDGDSDVGTGFCNNLWARTAASYYLAVFSVYKNCSKILLPTGWSTEKALLDWVANIIWSNIKIARKKLYVTMVGTAYTFGDKFKLENDATIYRPIKLVYDELQENTEMTLIECPEVEEFTLTEV